MLKTAFVNLIENACKYSAEKTVDVQLYAVKSELVIKFKDFGIGIPEKEIELIFQPFYRANNTHKSKGYGIGLSLVDRIIALHNGKIQVESIPRKGAEFIVKLPLLSVSN